MAEAISFASAAGLNREIFSHSGRRNPGGQLLPSPFCRLPSSFPPSSSSPPFSLFPTWRTSLSCYCSLRTRAPAKPLIRKSPFFSEGRDEDEGRLICPGCGVFMQDSHPNLPGYYQKRVARDKREIENGSIDFLSESDEILEEEDEATDGLSSRIDRGSDSEGGLSDESSVEGTKEKEEIKGEIDWDLDWEEEEDEEEKWRKELDGFTPAGVGYGNVTEETLQKMKKEKISKSEKKRKVREAKRSEAEESVTVCARCHSLRNYGQVKNQKVENLIPDFDFDRFISTRLMKPMTSAPVVVMVVDCVDFDGSFPK